MTKHRLNRARVIAAARTLLEAQGPAALSFRSIAAFLEVDPMALYRHVQDKLDLECAVADALLAELPLPDAGLPWRARLRQVLEDFYRLAKAHPHSFTLLHNAVLVHTSDLESEPRLNLALDQILREAHIPPFRVFQVRRYIIGGMLGYALIDVQATLRAGGELAPSEAMYPVMARSVERTTLEFAVEVQGVVPPNPLDHDTTEGTLSKTGERAVHNPAVPALPALEGKPREDKDPPAVTPLPSAEKVSEAEVAVKGVAPRRRKGSPARPPSDA